MKLACPDCGDQFEYDPYRDPFDCASCHRPLTMPALDDLPFNLQMQWRAERDAVIEKHEQIEEDVATRRERASAKQAKRDAKARQREEAQWEKAEARRQVAEAHAERVRLRYQRKREQAEQRIPPSPIALGFYIGVGVAAAFLLISLIFGALFGGCVILVGT